MTKVFINHYSNLSHVITNSIHPIADEMYSKRLISRDVKNDPSVSKIEREFLVLTSLYKEDVILLRQKCLMFLQCIASVKGPAEEVAIALARDWEHQVFKCNHIPFPLHQEMTKNSNFIVNSKDKIVVEFADLQEEFACLITEIREFYTVSKKHYVINIARWVEEFIDEVDCLAHENTNFDDVFRKMKPHYNLLDIELIERLIKIYPIDVALKSRFDAYSIKLDNFVQSVEISDIITRINTALQHEETKNHCKLVIKLSGKWSKQSISNFKKLMDYFFGDKAKYLTYEKFLNGSIIIHFVISSNKIALILIDMAYNRVRFMHHFGILQLIINNKTIINRNEENFKFEQSLYDAIISNFHNYMEYQKIILFLLQLEININYQNELGDTILMLASRNGHHQVVELLLSKDPDINIQNNEGMTALMFASGKGHHQVVEFLLSKDPDINIRNTDGWTALMFGCIFGHHKIVEFLLSKDPDINIQNNDKRTALMHASHNGHHQVVELLLNKDPDINIRNNEGMTALMFASGMGHHQVVEFLLSKDPDINIQNIAGLTALMFASDSGHCQVVELLLNKDPDITIQSNDKWTTLMYASHHGHHQVVELLLNKDPDINIQNNDGETALMYASGNGHHQVVELLLNKDPDINIQNNDGMTALMFASHHGPHQVVELLLSKDPDINIQNNDGLTALMFSCGNGHHQVVELLLNKDPDINIGNNFGMTALIYASHHGHHQVVKLLLDKDPDIDTQNKDGWTALMSASNNGHQQVVELLLNKNPNINLQNNIKWTALMLCTVSGRHEAVELLLGKDPDINIQNNEGFSAFTFILACSTFSFSGVLDIPPELRTQCMNQLDSGNYIRILELMLNSHPHHIHTMNDNNLHSLAVAALFNNFDAIRILMEKCEITPENIISAFTHACYACHSSMMIHLSEKINFSTNERKLLVAAAEGDLQMLNRMLYDFRMSPDTPLVAGITSLMIAASSGHIKIVKSLIQAGADVHKRNNEGYNALDIVNGIKFYDRADIKQLLITNTPAGPDSVSNNTESNIKKPSTVFSILDSFMKKSCNPYISSEVFDIAYPAMISTNMAQFVS